MSGIAVFDRSQRGARLTEMGEHLLSLGGQMLALRERMLDVKDGATCRPTACASASPS